MSSYMNFWETAPPDEKLAGKFPLARQTSIYSLTLDEFQTTLGGGKDFSSINMDDLLKSIWTAEETQALQSFPCGINRRNLQTHGSLSLPRTVSQRTVNQVWKDVLKETVGVNSGGLTLGEMTLEDFLSKAGVVREDDIQPPYYGITSGLTLGFQQPAQNGSIVQGGSSVATELSKGGSRGNNSLYADGVVKGSLEKVVERRQKRMMKNRESASRSRARKQAYILELEAEVTKLREKNEELKKKQKEFMEMQKNEILETTNKPWGEKKRCLRRTLTGPW